MWAENSLSSPRSGATRRALHGAGMGAHSRIGRARMGVAGSGRNGLLHEAVLGVVGVGQWIPSEPSTDRERGPGAHQTRGER